MYRNKKGELVFETPQEQAAYEKKKRDFLSRSDEGNVRHYERQMLTSFGYELPQPQIKEIVIHEPAADRKDIIVLAEQLIDLEKKYSKLANFIKENISGK